MKSLSCVSESHRKLIFTRPCFSGSLTFVTSAVTDCAAAAPQMGAARDIPPQDENGKDLIEPEKS